MATYVLVPGFWLGAWAWRPVTDALRALGHDVYPLSLTGLGERVHLASPDTDLETHITDVLNLLHYEDLRNVILVGHSYAGAAVIPVVADRAPERVAKLVFVDSGPIPDGMRQAEFADLEEQARNAELVATYGEGWKLPPPSWEEIPGVDPALPRDRAVPQPWATATSPVRLTGAWEKIARLGILCTLTERQARALATEVPAFRHMNDEQWHYVELPTSHWPMFSEPAKLTQILHNAA